MRLVLGHFHSLFFYAILCTAALVNHTIDDELGDEVTGLKPRYLPDGDTWSKGSSCSQCTITRIVDTAQVFDSTWHDTTYFVGTSPGVAIEASFNGTAVYVFNIIANILPNASVTFTNLTFYIDDRYVGAFSHTPHSGPPDLLYHVPVYTNSSLTDDEHTIRILADGSQNSLVLFDYIIYTSEDNESPPPPQSSSPPGHSKSAILTGSIVGAVVGAIVALLTLSIALYVLHLRGRLVMPLFRDKLHPPRSGQSPKSWRTTTSEVASRTSLLSFIRTPRSTSPVVSSWSQSDIDPAPMRLSAPGVAVIAPSPTPSPFRAERANTPLSIPPKHRADVPIPALSTTGTEHSLHLSGLMEEIRELEESLRDITGEKTPRESRRTDRAVSVGDLCNRLVHLRTQLEKERRLMAEAFPREREKRLAVVTGGAAGMDGLEDEMQPRRKRDRKGKPRELRVVS